MPNLDVARIQRAFEFAAKAHSGQMRKDGETPYIMHPLKTAEILTGLRVDEDTLIAGLLHDVPEDTDFSVKDVEKEFGKTVAFLVDGITKLSKVHFRHDMLERQIESLKKLFIHSARDPRIILIKLADRLHNMSTIDCIDRPEKRMRIARETLEIFVPIANLLGIWDLKHKLEDLCFRTLSRDDYQMIDDFVQRSAEKKAAMVRKTIKEIERSLKRQGIEHLEVQGRYKTHYGIFRKMLHSGKSFAEIFDLIGIRIIVNDIGDCYQALGVMHQHFTPKIGRLKDYIALPKSNGYQSIHTTVFGVDGAVTELQVRTMDMHLENEYGIAAHYFYRENQDKKRKQVKKHLQKKYEWVHKILDLQRSVRDNENFMRHLKLDIFSDRIFLFTPRGDVIDLPQGSTAIDFAYHIHSDIGMLAVGVKINGAPASLTTKLHNNDVVDVETSEESPGPQAEWLNIVQTNLARTRIREYLKEKDKTTLINEAEHMLDEKLKSFGFDGLAHLSKLQRVMLMEHFSCETWEKLLTEIGSGNINVRDVIKLLYSEQELLGEEFEPICAQAYERSTRHRIKELIPKKVRNVTLLLRTEDRVGILSDLCSELANVNVNILEVVSNHDPDHHETFLVKFSLEIEDFEQYEKVLYSMKKVSGVVDVTHVHKVVAPTVL